LAIIHILEIIHIKIAFGFLKALKYFSQNINYLELTRQKLCECQAIVTTGMFSKFCIIKKHWMSTCAIITCLIELFSESKLIFTH